MKSNIYIGNRYVPKFADPVQWDDQREYEPLTIVMNNGASYTSKIYVPIGTPLTDSTFWAKTGNYNAQVEEYANEVEELAGDFETAMQNVTNSLSSLGGRVTDCETDISRLGSEIDDLGTYVNDKLRMLDLGTVVCIGDSYLEGYTPSGDVSSWGDYLATLLGKTVGTSLKKYYKGGTGFVTTVDNVNFNTLVNTAYNDIGSAHANDVGCVLFVGGANEPSNISNQITQALNNAHSKFPYAKVLYAYGSSRIDQMPYNRINVTTHYQKAGITVPNSYYLGDLTMALKANPDAYSTDGLHLTADGYAYLAKMIANAMGGYRINMNRAHRTFDTNFMEYISNNTYVLQLFNPKAYTIEVEDHVASGEQLLYTINNDSYIQETDNLFYLADTNGYIKTSDGKFHNASFVLRLYPNRIEVYDYAINDTGTNYVAGTITAFQLKPFMFAIPISVI